MVIPVIILNHNSADDCRKCVSFLKRQCNVKLEIIIVGNCSRIDDCDEVKKLCKEQNCIFIQAHENRGYNAGNNIGLRYVAQGGYEYAMIVNPDMEFPEVDYVSKMIGQLNNNSDIAVIGADIVRIDGAHQNPLKQDRWKDCFDWIVTLFKSQHDEVYVDNYHKSHYCNKVSGCNLIVRMDFIRSIGFFDENVFLYCEEAILSRQVERAGKRLYYLADVHALHRHIKSVKGNPIKRLSIWRDSRIYYINTYSNVFWLAKKIACCSVNLHVFIFTVQSKIKQTWPIIKGKLF